MHCMQSRIGEEVISVSMLTVRNLDPEVKAEIQRRAARKGRSMEAEVRSILEQAANEPEPERNLAQVFADAFDGLNFELPEFDRSRHMPRGIDF